MKTIDHLGGRVAQLLYGPILLSELWAAVNYVAGAFILYAAALFLTEKLGLFAQFKNWPKVSKAALHVSPLLLLVGLYLSTRPPTYWVIAPLIANALLCMAGGLALGKKLDRDPPQPPRDFQLTAAVQLPPIRPNRPRVDSCARCFT